MDAGHFDLYGATDTDICEHALSLADGIAAGAVASCTSTGIVPPDPLRGIDPRYLRRRLRRAQALDVVARDAQRVGGDTGISYAPQRLVDIHRDARKRQGSFLRAGHLAKSASSDPSVPLSTVAADPRQLLARHIAFVEAFERLALEAGFRLIMLTATLEPSFHPNPTRGRCSWSGVSPAEAHKVLTGRFGDFRRALSNRGYRALGLHVGEPHEDGTPHLHSALALPRSGDALYSYCDAALATFGGTLKLIRGVGDSQTAAYYVGGALEPCSVDASARLTITVLDDPDEVQGAAKLSSYLMKYLEKGVGFGVLADTDSDAAGDADEPESSDLDRILAHRYGIGAKALTWLGLPPGCRTVWDLARQVDLDSLDAGTPTFARSLIEAAQTGIGDPSPDALRASDGAYAFLSLLGGLRVTLATSRPEGDVWYEARPLYEEALNRYGEPSKKPVGFKLELVTVVRERRVRQSGASAGKAYYRKVVSRGHVWSWRKADSFELCATAEDAAALAAMPTTREASLTSHADVVADSEDRPWTLPVDASVVTEAAAGSGKTYALVERVRYLRAKGIRPDAIRVVSFTCESASELSERLAHAGFPQVSATTMHAAAREHLLSLGEDVSDDYDEQIRQSAAFATRTLHVLVDEVQDLSRDQLDWIDAQARTIFAVGDPHQSLYVWRGADASSMSRLRSMVYE